MRYKIQFILKKRNKMVKVVVKNLPPTKKTESQVRVRKKTDIIVNPIFKECADLTTDPMWRSTFIEAAYGKFPRGFSYKDGYLYYKIRNKTTQIEISDEPELAIEDCREFFMKKAGIMSEDDQRKVKEDIDNYLREKGSLYPKTWQEIKRKKTREILISTFISKTVNKYNLTPYEKADLSDAISFGILIGAFGKHQIILEKGYIDHIEGLIFDPETRRFDVDPSFVPKNRKYPEPKAQCKKSFLQLWDKLLSNLETRVIRGSHIRTHSSRDTDVTSEV